MSRGVPPKIRAFSPAKQRQLDSLLEKNAAGTISTKEKLKLQSLVDEAEELMVANSRRLADFALRQAPQPPVAAVPVTVWVTPHPTER
ncbi:MAG: hypothetical protein AB7G28_04600 [Pirellulales bacterium]